VSLGAPIAAAAAAAAAAANGRHAAASNRQRKALKPSSDPVTRGIRRAPTRAAAVFLRHLFHVHHIFNLVSLDESYPSKSASSSLFECWFPMFVPSLSW
jgi:hypothetical protein